MFQKKKVVLVQLIWFCVLLVWIENLHCQNIRLDTPLNTVKTFYAGLMGKNYDMVSSALGGIQLEENYFEPPLPQAYEIMGIDTLEKNGRAIFDYGYKGEVEIVVLLTFLNPEEYPLLLQSPLLVSQTLRKIDDQWIIVRQSPVMDEGNLDFLDHMEEIFDESDFSDEP